MSMNRWFLAAGAVLTIMAFNAEIMWHHAGQMEAKMRDMGMAWPQFTENEMGDVIAFVQSRVGAR